MHGELIGFSEEKAVKKNEKGQLVLVEDKKAYHLSILARNSKGQTQVFRLPVEAKVVNFLRR